MKKILIITILMFSFFTNINITNAENTVKVSVTEKIPWANCTLKKGEENKIDTYECEVQKWASQIVEILWAIIKYFTYIAGLVWVLFIVANGIMYSMGWADQSLKDESKKRIIWTLMWLIVLLLSAPILQIIAPWIYK